MKWPGEMLPRRHRETRTRGDQGRDKGPQTSQLVPRQEAHSPPEAGGGVGFSYPLGNFRQTQPAIWGHFPSRETEPRRWLLPGGEAFSWKRGSLMGGPLNWRKRVREGGCWGKSPRASLAI